jgi:hypothetical protein
MGTTPEGRIAIEQMQKVDEDLYIGVGHWISYINLMCNTSAATQPSTD